LIDCKVYKLSKSITRHVIIATLHWFFSISPYQHPCEIFIFFAPLEKNFNFRIVKFNFDIASSQLWIRHPVKGKVQVSKKDKEKAP
jgi:hypothetical protein